MPTTLRLLDYRREVRLLDWRRTVRIYERSILTRLSDTFTDTNGVALASHAMDVGGGWTVRQGAGTIQGNRLRSTAGATQTLFTASAGVADGVIQVTVIPAATGAPGVLFRYADLLNFWYCRASDTGNNFTVVECNAGVFTTRATASVAVAAGTSYVITVTLRGAEVTATLDGANTLSYGAATLNQSSVLHGLTEAAAMASEFDAFTVTD